jgi:hypothetical protein
MLFRRFQGSEGVIPIRNFHRFRRALHPIVYFLRIIEPQHYRAVVAAEILIYFDLCHQKPNPVNLVLSGGAAVDGGWRTGSGLGRNHPKPIPHGLLDAFQFFGRDHTHMANCVAQMDEQTSFLE